MAKCKVLVIGAGKLGSKVICQLSKAGNIKIIVADKEQEPYAVKQGIIEAVDIVEHVNMRNILSLCQIHKPALILIARTAEDWGHGDTIMGKQFIARMEEELAAMDIPVIPVSSHIEF